ncbi:unnamed protein product [Sphagnum balticum]
MTPASAKQGSPNQDYQYDPSFIEVNAADQQEEIVEITEQNIGNIIVPQEDLGELNAEEFNLRANNFYLELVSGHIGKRHPRSVAEQIATSIKEQAATEVFNQMNAEYLQAESDERHSIASAYSENIQ